MSCFKIAMNLSVKESVYQMLLEYSGLLDEEVCNGLFQSGRYLLLMKNATTTFSSLRWQN